MRILNLNYLLFLLLALPFTGIAQELNNSKTLEHNITSFGWESFTEEFSAQDNKSGFSMLAMAREEKPYSFDFGFTAKQINSTSQWNHFSIHRDTREIKLLKRLDPNCNYPNHGIYRSNLNCQPYPIIDVEVTKNFSFSI
ncbi:hypothetical protein ACFQ3R_04770 [Mesonia ostreae]|uniref:Uncharacterized protein n=1 Tax=Mesonia ostreae TaxID=861110 RepID=A0ABU2KK60_9FLAO|nr:hypothetical protein [Mesonia ostreae]MDT0295127.1 hypothetical protein [Mesonia ostreae]